MTPIPAAHGRPPPRERRGLRRGSLSPELIVKESVRLLDEEGTEGFSLPKLGRALGADPTAVYRHFASKDDLVLAIADHLIEEATAGISPQPCWVTPWPTPRGACGAPISPIPRRPRSLPAARRSGLPR